MQSFTFSQPTEILFGPGAESQSGRLTAKHGGTRAFLLYGGGSAVASGLIRRIENSLRAEGIGCLPLGGVRPNPLLSFAETAREGAAAFGADFVLAAGGGSVIDTAKAVAHGLANPGVSIADIWSGAAAITRSAPVGVVLTIPAAGSEASSSAVLTNEATGMKRGFSSELNRPRFALMNPELALTLPRYQIACGVVDIMMHTLDRYFTAPAQNELTDALAEALLRVVITNGRKAFANPADYGAQSELMWAGSLSHNGLTGLGAQKDFSVHQLGHELSAKFDAAHGASLSAMWGAWAAYCMRDRPARFAQLGRAVWGVAEPEDTAAARAAIARTEAYFSSLEMPTCFTGLGIGVQPPDVMADLADHCVNFGGRTIGCFKRLCREDVLNIYQMANR